MLNLNMWLLLELCENRSRDEIELEYLDAVAPSTPRDEAVQQVDDGLAKLKNDNLIVMIKSD